VEFTRSAGNCFNVPFKVWLIDPRPGGDFLVVVSDVSVNVEESANSALDSDFDAREVGRVVGIRVGTGSRQESPFEVGLRNGIPLGNSGVVGSGRTLDVHALVAVNETNEPPTITRGLEANLQVSLVAVGALVPGGNGIAIVGGSTLLVNDEVAVYGGGDVEHVISARN